MNTKFLKNNLHFIIICLSVVVLGIIVGIAIDTDTNKKLTIKENEPDGESKINKLIINVNTMMCVSLWFSQILL